MGLAPLNAGVFGMIGDVVEYGQWKTHFRQENRYRIIKKARESTRAFLRDEIVRKSLTNISIIGKNRKRLWILHK
ncbi:hypothetical protein JCM17039_00030 [Blautia glucerasea]